MTQYVINIGTFPNDGTGDPLRTAFNEINLNFDQVFAAGPVGSNVQIANNTILTTNTNGNLVLAPNGIGVVQANVNIVPNTSNIRNLGAADRRWSTLYIQYANISGAITVADLTATGNVTVGGNLSVTGNVINIGNIVTDAKTIQLANTAGTANAANGSGITVGANDAIATFLFDSANNAWATNIGVAVGGPITGTSLAVSDAIVYGNTTGINALFTGTTTTPNIVVNNISSDDSTFVTIQDGLDVQGDITAETVSVTGNITGNYFIGNGSQLTGVSNYANANAVAYGQVGWAGNIVPAASNTYSLGNSTLWWSNIWVAGNTMYIGGVPIGMSAGNVLTVDGNAVLQNNSNSTISTTGNITADYFFGNGSQLTGLSTNSISNGTSNVDIPVANGNVAINTNGTYAWTFDDTGNLTLPTNGSIVVDGGDGVIGPVSDDLVISWDNEEIRLVSVQGSIEMQADAAFRVQTNYDGANVLYNSRWEFSNNELVNISNNFGIVSEAGNLTLSGGRDGVNSGNTIISAVDLGSAVFNWTFGNDGNLNLPSEGNIVGVTPNNAGRLQWVGNSSGDGFGFTTLNLVPDDTTGDGYLIIDPTGPNHIHIRAGGAQDDSGAQLFLGGENSYFKVDNGLNPNVYVSANTQVWTFGSTGAYGELTLPAGEGIIRAIDDTISLVSLNTTTGNANSVYLGSSGGLGFNDQEIGGNWLEIFRSGTEPEIRVPVGRGNLNIQTAEGGNVYNWTFDNTGNLIVPGAISAVGNITGNYFIGDGNQLTNVNAVTVDVTDTNGLTTIYYPTFVENRANAQIARADVDLTYRTDENLLTVGNVSVTGNITGNYFIGNGSQLTGLPAGYANSDVANFMAAFGSNSISTTGNVTANNISGNILVTGNVTGTTPNVTLIAGSYSWTFDNTGNTAFANGTITAGNISATGAVFGERLISTLSVGNEGGQINLSLPAANTTLTTSVTVDSFRDRFRVFETGGTNRGMFIDLDTSPAGGAAIGYRDIPQVSFTGNATLAASDAGKHYYSTQSTDYILTIANNTSVGWSVGTAITIVNRGTGNMTIAQGTGVSLYLAGNSTAGNRTVTTYGMATLLNVAANVWMINGTGVS